MPFIALAGVAFIDQLEQQRIRNAPFDHAPRRMMGDDHGPGKALAVHAVIVRDALRQST